MKKHLFDSSYASHFCKNMLSTIAGCKRIVAILTSKDEQKKIRRCLYIAFKCPFHWVHAVIPHDFTDHHYWGLE